MTLTFKVVIDIFLLITFKDIIPNRYLPMYLYIESTDLQLLLGSFLLPSGDPLESSTTNILIIKRFNLRPSIYFRCISFSTLRNNKGIIYWILSYEAKWNVFMQKLAFIEQNISLLFLHVHTWINKSLKEKKLGVCLHLEYRHLQIFSYIFLKCHFNTILNFFLEHSKELVQFIGWLDYTVSIDFNVLSRFILVILR